MGLERSDYFIIFEVLTSDPHITIQELRRKLPGSPHTKTVTKARNIAEWLLNQGIELPNPDEVKKIALINSTYGATVKYVYDVYDHLCAWRNNQIGKEIQKRRHLENVLMQVELLRFCLEHPTLNDLPERELLEVRGYDWRLDPMMWFYLCTPSFSRKDLWGPRFPMLESHMKESPFWEHLEQLRQAVKALEQDYDRIALNLFKNDQRFKKFWESVQFERLKRESDWGYKSSRTLHTPEPEPEDLKPYYDQEYAKEVMKRFIGIVSDLPLRQFELEKMLDQLHIDLLPDEINPLIVKGHCEKCP